MTVKISAIICVKNEARSLKKVVNKIENHVDEILIIDGRSQDNSRQIAESLGVRLFIDNGQGKGAGIRLGIKKAKGNILVFIDADGSHQPKDTPKLVRPIVAGRANLVVASRGKGGSDELHGNLEKTIRLIGSALITLIINWRFGTDLTDTQNGFRAIEKNTAEDLNLQEDIFTIEQEMIIKALKKGYKIKEVASHEYEREHGQSKIKLSTMGWRYIWCLIKNIF